MDRELFSTVKMGFAACLLSFSPADVLPQSPPTESCSNSAVVATTPSSEFTIVGDGIIRHDATGLEWQRCSVGQIWDGAACQGSASNFFWQQALIAASVAGSGWRLPNIQELRSIVERCRVNPAINRKAFPNTSSFEGGIFWSSTPSTVAGLEGLAMIIYFDDGNEGASDEIIDGIDGSRLRLVRDGQ